MCLSTVSKTSAGTDTLIESGWKYFNGDLFPHQSWNGRSTCPLDKWITADNIGRDLGGYKAGFHVFTDEVQARRKITGKLRRVYFRRTVAQGLDQGVETIVAQEMYVPSKEDTWPPKV